MKDDSLKILMYAVVVLLILILFKLWSMLSNYFVKKKTFDNVTEDNLKRNLLECYFVIHFLIYINGLFILFFYSWIEYLNVYLLIPLGLSLILTYIFYKKLNPKLTKIISSYSIIDYTSKIYNESIKKRETIFYIINTFLVMVIITVSISVFIAYFIN